MSDHPCKFMCAIVRDRGAWPGLCTFKCYAELREKNNPYRKWTWRDRVWKLFHPDGRWV